MANQLDWFWSYVRAIRLLIRVIRKFLWNGSLFQRRHNFGYIFSTCKWWVKLYWLGGISSCYSCSSFTRVIWICFLDQLSRIFQMSWIIWTWRFCNKAAFIWKLFNLSILMSWLDKGVTSWILFIRNYFNFLINFIWASWKSNRAISWLLSRKNWFLLANRSLIIWTFLWILSWTSNWWSRSIRVLNRFLFWTLNWVLSWT